MLTKCCYYAHYAQVRQESYYAQNYAGIMCQGLKIAHGSSIKRVRSVGSISSQEDIHRSGEKNNELLIDCHVLEADIARERP